MMNNVMGNLRGTIAKQILLSLGLFFSFSQLSAMCPQAVGTVVPGEGIWRVLSRVGIAANEIQSQICSLTLSSSVSIDCTFTFGQAEIGSGGIYTISAPGIYCMRENVSFTTSAAITVNSNDVTINMEGHTLNGTNNNTTGIVLNSGIQNVTIHNGIIENLAGGLCPNVLLVACDTLSSVSVCGACPAGIAICDALGSVATLRNVTIQDMNFNNNSVAAIQFTLATAPTLDVDGLFIQNCNAYNSGGIFATAIGGIVQGCIVNENRGPGFQGGIVLQGRESNLAESLLIQDCIVTSSLGNSYGYISLAFVQSGVIKNCISQEVALDAFSTGIFQNMVISDCVAQGNSVGAGFSVSNPLPDAALVIERCVASDCGDSGFLITTTGMNPAANTFSAIKVIDCLAENNVMNGFVFLNFLSMGDSLIARCCAMANGSNGFLVNNSYVNPGPLFTMAQLVFEDCVAQGNDGDGFALLSAQTNGIIENVVFRNCDAQGNLGGFDGFSVFQGDGFGIGSATGSPSPNLGPIRGVICQNCIAQANVHDGFNFASTVTLSKIIDCCAMKNTGTGIKNALGAANVVLGNRAFFNTAADITGVGDPTLIAKYTFPGALAGATTWVNATT
jgi:hypothetical protein